MPARATAVASAVNTDFSMKSVSFPDGPVASVQGGTPPVPVSPAVWEQSRLPSWSPSAVYCGDDLPGVPLDCFTSSMIDDGSDPSWVPYEHRGCDPVFDERCPDCAELECLCSESGEGSGEEPDQMEVDQD